MKLFTFKDGDINLDREEVALVKEFNAILRRDIKDKKQAFKELAYIYHMCDGNSYPNRHGLSEREAHIWSVDASDLPIGYKPDDAVLAAMRRYEQMRPSPLEHIAKEIRAVFNTSHRVIKALRLKVEESIDSEELKGEDLQNAVAALDRVLSLSESIPKKMRAIREMDVLIEEEGKDYEKMRGGGDIDESMDPDNAAG